MGVYHHHSYVVLGFYSSHHLQIETEEVSGDTQSVLKSGCINPHRYFLSVSIYLTAFFVHYFEHALSDSQVEYDKVSVTSSRLTSLRCLSVTGSQFHILASCISDHVPLMRLSSMLGISTRAESEVSIFFF